MFENLKQLFKSFYSVPAKESIQRENKQTVKVSLVRNPEMLDKLKRACYDEFQILVNNQFECFDNMSLTSQHYHQLILETISLQNKFVQKLIDADSRSSVKSLYAYEKLYFRCYLDKYFLQFREALEELNDEKRG